MRRLTRLAVTAVAALAAMSCTDAPTASEQAAARGQIALAPSFSPSAALAYNALPAFGLEITSVRVILTAPDGTTQDRTIAFPPDVNELRIELTVPLRTAGQTFRAELELRNGEGQVLFRGGQDVVAHASNVPGTVVAPAPVDIRYTGPGADVRSVAVTPAVTTLVGPGTVSLDAAALNATGGSVQDFIVRWTTSDATLATVTSTGNMSATVTSAGRRGVVTLSAITPLGVTGTARVTLLPAAARIVAVSGGGQTAPAGSTLPQPFVVEVQATDNLPVPGAPVTFRAITSGSSVVTTTAVTDASGRASTSLTLGRTAGSYQFEAASAALAPVTVSQTATAAPAASIEIASGNAQSAPVGGTLGAPLTVRVLDQFGAIVAGSTVQWAKVAGAGTVGTATSTTDASGIATNTYRFGNASGTESVRASLPGVSSASGDVIFSMQAVAGPPSSITGAGEGQRGPAGTVLSKPLAIRVTDAFGNPSVGADVIWRVKPGTTGSATFSPQVSRTGTFGTSETTVTLGTTVGPLTVQALVGGLVIDFDLTIEAPVVIGNPGTIHGLVYDAVTGAPKAGVSVTGSSFSVTTGSDGRFTTPQLPAGSYNLTFTISGYVTTQILGLQVNGNTTTEAVPLVPASSSPGTISGRVINATTGQNITATATVELRAGLNATTGTPLQTVTTTNAIYVFSNVAAGTYTVLARATGFTDAFKTGIAVGAQTTNNQNIVISPQGAVGVVRIVLTWHSSPSDLDSYLTGPVGTSTTQRFQVWYGGQGNCTSAPFACLDQDVTSGFGPETMTISQVLTGRYRFSVHNYSGGVATALSNSNAKVNVYISNVLAATFSVPAGSGRYWTVFDYENGVITSINTVGTAANYTNIPLPSGISASRNPSRPNAAAVDDNAAIAESVRTHPKTRRTPR